MNRTVIDCDLFQETNDLKNTRLWRNFVSEKIDWLEIYKNFILNLQNSGKIPTVNINVNNSVKPWLKTKIFDHKVSDYNNLEDWFIKWLDDDDFCILFDRITDYSEEVFNLLVSKIISGLGDRNFSIGADSYAIFGNYGYTPFGIHPDSEPIFLIHCGPGSKDLWYWEEKPNEEYIGRHDILELNDDWKEDAVHVVLEPGDMIFIPSQVYHLLYTKDFSITLGTAIFPGNASSLVRTGISNLPILNSTNNEVTVTWSNEETMKSEFNKILTEDFGFQYMDLGEAVYQGLLDQQYKLRSNGGFIGAPITNMESKMDYKNNCFKLKKNTEIAFRKKNDELILYLRGRICKIGYNSLIENVLNLINTKPKFSFNNLLEIVEDEKVVSKLLDLFYQHKCIEIACCCKLEGNPQHV
ncbi:MULTISPECIES: JmjC domain-containing protein [Lysinibacillus]|uniref:JmjC domain-containing protein n=1 Tax=Lysinibacillus TaxID=400634 RepID=UPI0004DF9248|nr:cupin domain-containing protein [Lysinibacillus sphaericus]MBG9691494.1 hypothetical protein [Lysinibacillus sphaericus]QPA59063.1 hypothetical protein INQ55_01305 [Lysinibacillus sphaericus]